MTAMSRRAALARRPATLAAPAQLPLALPLLAKPLMAPTRWEPERPIRVVVTFAPGGAVDTLARLLAPALSERLGRPRVVENRGGASGAIGAAAVAPDAAAPAPPLGLALSTHAVNPALNPRQPFGTIADVAPVGRVGGAPVILAANRASPLRALQDMAAAGRRPGQGPASGSTGNGNEGG